MGREAILPVVIAHAIACGDSPREIPAPTTSPGPSPSHLEQSIERQLSAKLGRGVRVSCSKTTCRADLGDAVLPIAIKRDGSKGARSDYAWSIEGLLVRAAPIEAYLKGALVDLGAPQGVSCGPAIRSVEPGARIECTLEHGGKAFAVIAADGSFSTEIDLDPAAAAARSVDPTQPLVDPSGSGEHDDDDD